MKVENIRLKSPLLFGMACLVFCTGNTVLKTTSCPKSSEKMSHATEIPLNDTVPMQVSKAKNTAMSHPKTAIQNSTDITHGNWLYQNANSAILNTMFSPPVKTGGITRTNITDNVSRFGIAVLEQDTVEKCLRQSGQLRYRALKGSMTFQYAYPMKLPTSARCSIHILAPKERIFRFAVHRRTYASLFSATAVDHFVSPAPDKPFWTVIEENPPLLFSSTNNITVHLWRNGSLFDDFRLICNFTTIPKEGQPEVEVLSVSDTTGYIQSPLWDGMTAYPTDMDGWASLTLPATHTAVMVRFLELSLAACSFDKVEVYVGGQTASHFAQRYCRDLPSAEQYTDDVHIHFVSGAVNSVYTGFRLEYSFMKDVLQRLGHLWNCSIPNFNTDYRRFFPCNTQWNCVHGEDEEDCPYTNNSKCEEGQWWAAGRCYQYVDEKYAVWIEASAVCKDRGGVLASLNTPEEWRVVRQLLALRQAHSVYLGLRSFSHRISNMYRGGLQWQDNTTAFCRETSQLAPGITGKNGSPLCCFFNWRNGRNQSLFHQKCDYPGQSSRPLCEFDPESENDTAKHIQSIQLTEPKIQSSSLVRCQAGHLAHEFLALDQVGNCRVKLGRAGRCSCLSVSQMSPPPPSFTCNNNVEQVAYTLVCDHRPDCSDSSDEDFCLFTPCDAHVTFDCGGSQCLQLDQRCDGMAQCVSASDEIDCFGQERKVFEGAVYSKLIVNVNTGDDKELTAIRLDPRGLPPDRFCPLTHFKCPDSTSHLCLPVYLRCNNVIDCPGQEDEAECDTYACPGYYRCHNSRICLHPNHMCDNVYGQCPQNDDELLCGLVCPRGCRCFGMAFYCNVPFSVGQYDQLRFLKADKSNMTLEDVRNNKMLVHLGLANCFITCVPAPNLPNLYSLDLSDNLLAYVFDTFFENIPNLRVLNLAGSPLNSDMSGYHFRSAMELRVLDLSRIRINNLDPSTFMYKTHLHTINLSYSGLRTVYGSGFKSLTALQSIDLSGCPMKQFPPEIFQNLNKLRSVIASNYKLCCSAVLPPGFNPSWCKAPSDLVSSCEGLLRSNIYRVALSLLAILSLTGNLTTLLYRTFVDKRTRFLGFGVFVLHLCASDFAMGTYLAVIGLADHTYKQSYLWNDSRWTRSAACKLAGFLCVLSSEVSAFFICIITLDRFLVLRFPFSHFHFAARSAHVTGCAVWTLGVTLATIPLMPMTSHWEFYSQTGICIPLPVKRDDFPGHVYTFGVFVGLNFVVFLFIAAGQGFIYWSVRTNAFTGMDNDRKSKDLMIARRLIAVAVSDFLCWFPIGVLGLLVLRDVPIPGEVSVAMVMLVLPLNSAINPFIYTINVIFEHRTKVQEKRLLAILSKLQDVQ